VLLAAGRAAGEMRGKRRHGRGGVGAGDLELDVAVELVEALVAAELRHAGAEQPAERLLELGSLHHSSFSSQVSWESPLACRCARSFLRASCNVL
jgi:hypothetical protein